MAFVLADRVKETASAPGTGTVTLLGAATGYQSFSAGIGASNTTYYTIADQTGSNWEVGYGTVGAGGTTLARTTVLASSNSGSLVNFASGTQDVWCDYAAKKAVIQDSLGTATVPQLASSSTTSTTPVLSFNAANTSYASGSTVANNFLQTVLQNKSGTSGASTNYVLSNDLGTDSTYYGEFGMNSSVYSASTPSDFFSINNGIYFSGHDGDITVGSGNGFKHYMAWGTTGQSAHVINASGALGFSTNLGTTPALSGTTGYGTSGQALVSAGSAAAPAWGTLGVAGGGTGSTTLTANNVLLGNGTSALQVVAPGTSGNVLTSNGTTWTSAAPSAAGVSSITGTTSQVIASASTGAVTLSLPQSIATTSSVQFGSFGVGTAASGTTGEIRATNNVTAYYSDERLKTKVGNIENALDKVKQIETMVYHANETAVALGYDASIIEVGVTAQSVQKVMPQTVAPAPIDDKYLTVRYERLVPLLIEAIKELEAQVAELKAK